MSAPVSIAHAKAVNSPSAYVELDGIGTDESVTEAIFLYVNTQSPMKLRVTFTDTPDVVSEIWVQGPFVIEMPSSNPIKLLEAKGVGTIEYFAAGNQ